MSFAQIGLFVGMTVAICVRINSNKDTVLSIFDAGRRSMAHMYASGKNQPFMERSMLKEGRFNFRVVAIKFFCAAIPFAFSLLIEKNAVMVISLISSIYCPYFIVIIPGGLTRTHEPPGSIPVQNRLPSKETHPDIHIRIYPSPGNKCRCGHLQIRKRKKYYIKLTHLNIIV
jgi:hypothetical protein